MRHLARRVALSVPAALFMTMVLASQALAYAWPIATELSPDATYPKTGLATDGVTHSVATWVEWNGSGYDVMVAHSGAAGWSWEAPMVLSSDGFEPAVSGYGQYFDVVFEQNSRVRYARSTNNGVSFGASIALTPAGGPLPTRLSVARGADGTVVVAWQKANNSSIMARVSTNGGFSFGAATTVSTGAVSVYMGTDVAVGEGVIYVAYSPNGNKLFVARSTNDGATWTPTEISNRPWEYYETAEPQFSITADGANAYIAYAIEKADPSVPSVKYKRTTNSGNSWSSEMNLAPPRWKTWEPDIALQGGVLRAAFTRKAPTPHIYYRESSNGLTWSAAEGGFIGDTPSVGFATDIVLVYAYIPPDDGIIARVGQ